jgi:hypothetical protein
VGLGDRIRGKQVALLVDFEHLGTVRLRPRPPRGRLETLLTAAGEIHHAVAVRRRVWPASTATRSTTHWNAARQNA